MSIAVYLREKIIFIILEISFIFFVILMSYAFKVKAEYTVAIVVLLFICNIVLFLYDYPKRKNFYITFEAQLNELDRKYLIAEIAARPDFFEGQFLCDSLYEINKSMIERINEVEKTQKEFKEYIELWIHEIKLPISSLSLMNYNRNTDFVAQKAQIQKLSSIAEQILYLSRADNPQEDYLLKETELEGIINKVVVTHKDLLIGKSIAIQKQNLSYRVVTDTKWFEFILGQIVNNSIKYVEDRDRKIKFSAKEDFGKIVLEIYDNGVGVSESDLPKVFERTFTGNNGRKVADSTGMGLYICKKLCDKLGHRIWMESREGVYTKVFIEFGKEEYCNFDI